MRNRNAKRIPKITSPLKETADRDSGEPPRNVRSNWWRIGLSQVVQAHAAQIGLITNEKLKRPLHHKREYAQTLIRKLDASENLLAICRRSCTVDLQDSEALGLGSGAVLSDGDLVSIAEAEARGSVCGDVAVALFESLVLADPMKVIPADDDGLLHLGRHDDAGEQTAADGDVTSKGTLLVDVGALDGLARGLDAQSDIAEPPAVLAAHATY